MFCLTELETSLIVVSEKIITVNPIKKVINLSLWYFEFSFEIIINKKGIRVRIGI